MPGTVDFLEAIRASYALTSDYQIAKKTGLSKQAVSRFLSGKDVLGESTAGKVAELLDLEPAYVLACAHLENPRTDDVKSIWDTIRLKFRPSPTQQAVLRERFPGCILCSIPNA